MRCKGLLEGNLELDTPTPFNFRANDLGLPLYCFQPKENMGRFFILFDQSEIQWKGTGKFNSPTPYEN